MAICPKTLRACIDDLCYGGGCMLLGWDVPMLTHCGGCGKLVGLDGSDPLDECECPLDDDDPFADDEQSSV